MLFIIIMKYNNSFMRMYRVLMEENARFKEYIKKIEIEKQMMQRHKHTEHINKKNKNNNKIDW